MILKYAHEFIGFRFPIFFKVLLKMPKDNVRFYYAVGKGRQTGVFDSWPECNKQINGIANAKYKKFPTYEEAESFVNQWKNSSSPKKFTTPKKEEPSPTQICYTVSKIGKNEQPKQMIYNCKDKFSLGVKIKDEFNSLEKEEVFIPLEVKEEIRPVQNTKKLKDSEFYNFNTYYIRKNRSSNELQKLSLEEIEKILKSRKNLSMNVNQNNITKILTEMFNNNPDGLKNALQLFFQLIGMSVNPQMETQPMTQPSTSNQLTKTTEVNNTEPDNKLSNVKETNQIDLADIKAVNLRMDAFEKRFDDCLKQMGAITAELEHVRGQVKTLQESFQDYLAKEKSNGPRDGGRSYEHRSVSIQNAFKDAVEPVRLSSNSRESSEEPSSSRSTKKLKRKRSPSRRTRRGNGSSQSGDSQPNTSNNCEIRIKKEKELKQEELQPFIVGNDEFVHVYTDGCCHYNGKPNAKAGVGIWFGENHPMNVAKPLESEAPPTNNNAEIQAATLAIRLAAEAGIKKLRIFTDSEFTIKCVKDYMPRWKIYGWRTADRKEVKNKTELLKLDEALKLIEVEWEQVPAHTGILGNERADALANEGALRYKPNNESR